MKLHFVKTGQGPALVILHGLMGSGDNWRTHALELSKYLTVYCVDLRDHGRSAHSGQISYPLMTADILELMDDEGLEQAALLGHSMGGKVVMQAALDHPDRVSRLIVADMAPQDYFERHTLILDALESVNLALLKTRQEAEQILADKGLEPGVYQFLLKSLYRKEEGGFGWRFNLAAIRANYQNILDDIDADGKIYDKPSLFIRGGNSDYVPDFILPHIGTLFPHYELITLPKVGHWVHAEAPQPFLAAVKQFLHLS